MKKNLSQSQLAAKMQTMNVNMDQQMISKIENNARFVTDYELACFCLILEIDLLIQRGARMIGMAINAALNPCFTVNDFELLTK